MADIQTPALVNQQPTRQWGPSSIIRKSSRTLRDAVSGAAIGALCGSLFSELSFADRPGRYIVLIATVAFALICVTRFRPLIWSAGTTAVGGLLIVAFTPVVPWMLPTPAPADALERCDAVVSLGFGVNDDGTLASNTQDRVVHAMSVLRGDYAPTLVLTGGEELGEPVVRRQMNALGLKYPIENVGAVKNTHDEGVAVAQLARARGWKRVILVTNGWHMKRAAATFEKAGVHVLRSPCPDSRGDMVHPSRLSDRIRALACWLHESIGYRVYRLRGWI
jgi:uncharacterized SAM-binding protein YcdF (DUF218 family)